MAKQEKEVALGKDNVVTLAGSTPFQCELPTSYFSIMFGIGLISTKK